MHGPDKAAAAQKAFVGSACKIVTQLRQSIRDGHIVFLLFAITFAAVYVHLQKHGWHFFYQTEFTPALTWACTGHFTNLGFLAPDQAPPSPDLQPILDFLTEKTPTFDCAKMPLDAAVGRQPLDIVQRQTLYLIFATGATWALLGISWAKIYLIGAFLAGLFVTAVYGVARLFVSWPFAAAAAILTGFNKTNNYMLPELRDYAKAPFIITFVFFAGWMIASFPDRKKVLAAAALGGAISGIGAGVRGDLIAVIPFFAVLIAFLLVSHRFRGVGLLAGATLVFGLCFAVAAFPTFYGYDGGGSLGHVSLLGLTTPYNASLGLSNPLYDIGQVHGLYGDRFIGHVVHAFAGHFDSFMEMVGPEYARQSMKLLVTFALNFPADIIIRAYSSIMMILSVDLGWLVRLPMPWLTSDVLLLLGMLVFFFGIAATAMRDVRLGLFLAMAVAYFCGMCALQFDFRHAFYLQCFYWIALVVVVSTAWELFTSKIALRRFAIGASAALLCFGFAALTLSAARAYQSRHVARLIDRYLAADRERATTRDVAQGDAIIVEPVGSMIDMQGRHVDRSDIVFDGFYLRATFDPEKCAGKEIPLTALYTGNAPFTRKISLRLGNDLRPSTLFFPVMHCDKSCGFYYAAYFVGLSVPAAQRACLTRIDAVKPSHDIPLKIWLDVPGDWKTSSQLYQTRERSLFSALKEKVVAAPPSLASAVRSEPVIFPLPATGWSTISPSKIRGSGVTIQGTPSASGYYGAVSAWQDLKKGQIVAARGNIWHGGVVLGLIGRDGTWKATVEMPEGEIKAFVEVPDDGSYQVVVANNLSPWQSSNNVVLDQVGILQP